MKTEAALKREAEKKTRELKKKVARYQEVQQIVSALIPLRSGLVHLKRSIADRTSMLQALYKRPHPQELDPLFKQMLDLDLRARQQMSKLDADYEKSIRELATLEADLEKEVK
jgi:hypothetical protein